MTTYCSRVVFQASLSREMNQSPQPRKVVEAKAGQLDSAERDYCTGVWYFIKVAAVSRGETAAPNSTNNTCVCLPGQNNASFTPLFAVPCCAVDLSPTPLSTIRHRIQETGIGVSI